VLKAADASRLNNPGPLVLNWEGVEARKTWEISIVGGRHGGAWKPWDAEAVSNSKRKMGEAPAGTLQPGERQPQESSMPQTRELT